MLINNAKKDNDNSFYLLNFVCKIILSLILDLTWHGGMKQFTELNNESVIRRLFTRSCQF